MGLCVGFDWPGRAGRLAADMERANPRERREIVRLLAASGSAEAEPALLQACDDADPGVRREALQAAGRIGAKRTIPVLLKSLSDPDAVIRGTAAAALGTLGAVEAVPALSRALADSETSVRRAAVEALGKLPQEGEQLGPLIAALDDIDVEVRVAAVHALALSATARARDALLGKTRDNAADVRAAALDAVASAADPRASVALSQALEDSSDAVVLAAIRGLRNLNDPHTTEWLSPLVRSPRARIALAARLAIEHAAKASEPEAASAQAPSVAAWIPWLERTVDPNPDAAAIVAGLEATLPDGEELALDPLVLYLPHAPKAQRARVVALIGRTRARAAIPTLVRCLEDEQAAVRTASALALGGLGTAAQTPALALRLDDGHPQVRAAAAHAMGALVDLSGLDALVARAERAAQSDGHSVDGLTAIAGSLRRLRDRLPDKTRERVERLLSSALLSVDAGPSVEAARALGELGDTSAVAALGGVGANARTGLRVAATRALVRAGEVHALAPLRKLASDENTAVAATALAGLGILGDGKDRPALESAIAKGRWPLGPVAAFSLASLVMRGQAPSDALCALLNAQEPWTRINAQAALAAHPSARCPRVTHERMPGDALTEAPPYTSWRALVLSDGRVLLSHPDALGQVDFPGVASAGSTSPWRLPYGTR